MHITIYPCSLSDNISFLNKSPALKCVNPKVSASFAHWVPFPLPGPPGTWKLQKRVEAQQYQLNAYQCLIEMHITKASSFTEEKKENYPGLSIKQWSILGLSRSVFSPHICILNLPYFDFSTLKFVFAYSPWNLINYSNCTLKLTSNMNHHYHHSSLPMLSWSAT